MLRAIVMRRSIYMALIIGVVAFALASSLMRRADATVLGPQGTMVALLPPPAARAGELITVKLVVQNAHNLAGFQSTVSFDSTKLRLTGATIERGLTRSGRGMLQLGPVLRDSSVVVGAATCPAAVCSDPRPSQAARILQGVDGDADLATVSFYTETPGRYELTLGGVQLVDPQGVPLVAGTASALLDVTAR